MCIKALMKNNRKREREIKEGKRNKRKREDIKKGIKRERYRDTERQRDREGGDRRRVCLELKLGQIEQLEEANKIGDLRE